MKKAFLLVVILFVSVLSTACINNLAVQELNNKAKAYLESGDYENAISRLKSSLDLDNTIFETHYNLGIAYTQAEEYPKALETFQNAVKIKPDFADVYYSVAVAQENYSKGIIDGTYGKNDKNAKDEKQEEKSEHKLTAEESQQVQKLLEDSISSYETYLQKSGAAEDKNEVEEKIEYLKTQLTKYSADKAE